MDPSSSSQAPRIGNLPYLSNNPSNWRSFNERMDLYFSLNKIESEHRKTALLLTTINVKAYQSLYDLCHPKLPKDKTYQELVNMMAKLLERRPLKFRERVKFYRSKQEENETIAEWYDRLKKLSINCKYVYDLEVFLLDQFIAGLHSDVILNYLCDESEENMLTIQRAVEIATVIEKSIQTNDNV